MCGRYRRRSTKEKLAAQFAVEHGLEDLEIEPEEEIAPGSMQPVVYLTPEGERTLALMRWGFKLPDRFLFNTRSETIQYARFWKESFRERRCIVPADAFFEWSSTSAKRKKKFEISLERAELFGMAAVWSSWQNPRTGQWEQTFSILTTEANEAMRRIHDRQPEILAPDEYTEYLAPASRPPVHLLRILPSEEMRINESFAEKATQQSLFGSEI